MSLAPFDASCHGRDGEHRDAHEWQSPRSLDRCCQHCGMVATVFFDAAIRAPLGAAASRRKRSSATGIERSHP